MKHIQTVLIASLLASPASTLAGIAAVSAQTSATMTTNAGNAYYAALNDFDVPALDFNIQTFVGDQLNALVVAKSGTAREVFEYKSVHLYADRGIEGLQGWGYDQYLGQAEYDSGLWVFKSISYTFAKPDQRFFVTLETSDLPQGKTMQFSLLQAGDNGNGRYDAGEQGVFLASGVIAKAPEPSYSNVVYTSGLKSDVAGPSAYIADVSIDQSAPTMISAPTAEIVFTGEARDRLGGSVQGVKLDINGQIVNAQNTDVEFKKWRAVYVPSQAVESLTISVLATDGNNETMSAPYYMSIDSRQVEAVKSTVSVTPDRLQIGQSAQIMVTLRSDGGEVLPNRAAHFSSLRIEDDLSSLDRVTDEQGQATVTFTPQSIGTAKVEVHSGTLLIGSATVIVTEQIAEEEPEPESPYHAGDLIKGSQNAVYFYGSDGQRHVFVNAEIYTSWYGSDFSKVKTLSDAMIASIPLGKPVPFKPGTLIKVPSVPAVYVVDVDQTLRHIETEQVAKDLFGPTWNKQVHDLSEALLFTYNFGSSVSRVQELDKTAFTHPLLTIDSELH